VIYRRTLRVFGLIFAFSMLTAVANAAACSNTSLKGIYGIWITGYDSSGAYQQSVSQIDSNGKGTFTGTETESDAGTIYNDVAITGTYSIAADCTGSGTIINPKNGNEAHYNFLVDPVAKQIDAVGTDSGHGTASGQVVSLGKATCTAASVKGTYGFHGGGLDTGSQWQFAGQYILDGAGNVTGTETSVVTGVVASAVPLTGTYVVGPSCTATITVSGSAPYNLDVVFIQAAKAFFAIETDSGYVGTLVAHQ
jgi:hypothetical protein